MAFQKKYIRNRAKSKRNHIEPILTKRMVIFVRKFIENGGRPTVAARAAGYEFPAREGTRLQRHPLVMKELEKHRKHLEKKHGVTVDRLMGELEAIAFTDAASLMEVDEDGSISYSLEDMTVEQRKLIAGMEQVEFMEGKGVLSTDKRKTKITFHSKQAALEMMGRILGAFNDKLEVTEGMSRAERVAAGRKRSATRNAALKEEVAEGDED